MYYLGVESRDVSAPPTACKQTLIMESRLLLVFLYASPLLVVQATSSAHHLESGNLSYNADANLSLNLTSIESKVDPEFLSVTLLVYLARSDWSEVNFTAPRLVNMAKALNPCMLRLGGTGEDFMTFNASQSLGGMGMC